MDNILGKLREEKPNIRETSLRQYNSVIKSLHKALKGTTAFNDLDFLKEHKQVMKVVNTKAKTTAKNYLTAIVVVLKLFPKRYERDIKVYTETLYERIAEYKKFIDSQQKTQKQEDNWLEWREVIKVLNKLNKEITDKGIRKKTAQGITAKEKDLLQQHLILSLYTLQAPVRSSPYADTKIIAQKAYKKLSDKQEEAHNWLVVGNRQKQFVLNQYKTSKAYGKRTIKVSNKLNRILNAWLRIHKEEYLLTKRNGSKLNSNNITKYLNKVFRRYGYKKNISSSMLRHIFLSHEMKDDKARVKKQELAKAMGHSVATQEDYVKKD